MPALIQHLRLRLDGDAVRFPDGEPFCLACGAPPSTTRTLHFKHHPLDLKPGDPRHALPAHKRYAVLSFEAPLCAAHAARARGLWAAIAGLSIAGVVLLALGYAFGVRQGFAPRKAWGLGCLFALPGFGPALFLWNRARAGGLPCRVELREGGDLLLVYADGAPRRR